MDILTNLWQALLPLEHNDYQPRELWAVGINDKKEIRIAKICSTQDLIDKFPTLVLEYNLFVLHVYVVPAITYPFYLRKRY